MPRMIGGFGGGEEGGVTGRGPRYMPPVNWNNVDPGSRPANLQNMQGMLSSLVGGGGASMGGAPAITPHPAMAPQLGGMNPGMGRMNPGLGGARPPMRAFRPGAGRMQRRLR